MDTYKRYAKESEEEFIFRVCERKSEIGSWNEVCDILNDELDRDWDESTYRKKYQSFKNLFEANKQKFFDNEYLEELISKQDEAYKQEVRTRDWVNTKRKILRDESRIETIIQAIKEDCDTFDVEIRPYKGDYFEDKSAVLCIGDWHIGDYVDNFRNKFNLEEVEKRVESLQNDIINYCHAMKVKTLNIVNLGDMINGNLRVTNRVENEFDVIQQIKVAARVVYKFIMNLSSEIEEVTYRSVLDNHSRANQNYKEHIEKENFGKLIDWWLETKFEDSPVQMIYDNIDENIGYFTLNGKNIFFAHGHLENPNTVTQDMTFGTNIIADIVILGHYHIDKVKNFKGKKVYFNGSLKGTDTFALNKRLFGEASQTLLIFDKQNVIDIPIILNK